MSTYGSKKFTTSKVVMHLQKLSCLTPRDTLDISTRLEGELFSAQVSTWCVAQSLHDRAVNKDTCKLCAQKCMAMADRVCLGTRTAQTRCAVYSKWCSAISVGSCAVSMSSKTDIRTHTQISLEAQRTPTTGVPHPVSYPAPWERRNFHSKDRVSKQY